jgi:type IV pilus assembly protein PilC
MPNYHYTAKDANGSTVAGSLEMPSEYDIIEALHKRDLVVVSIEQEKKKFKISRDKKVKLDDIVIFSRQLATMVDAGIPLVQALGILVEQLDNKSFKQVVRSVNQDIESGMSFCDALSKHPDVFSEFFINMSRAGEASGMLHEVLDRLAAYLEKTAALIRKVKSGMVYPVVVVSMAMIITAVLLLKVVPTFKGIFETLGGQLPLPTLILIGVSDTLRHYFLFVVIVSVLLCIVFGKYIRTEKGRYNLDKTKLGFPILGTLFQKVAVAKFARTLSTLVKSGVQILAALEIVGKTAGNKVIEEAITNCRTSIREGESIAAPLAKSGVFPPMVTRMIAVGEQTGELEKMLTKVADFYDEQVDAAVSGLTSMIEPLVIAFLGIVIGGIVVALFLPVFKISELIAR